MSTTLDQLEESVRQYDDGYYDKQLKVGLEFQDHVIDGLYKRGIVIVSYGSKKWQRLGENRLGAEIKRDGYFRETGQLYIETSEKSNPRNQAYVASGIFRDDNSWLFIIGDEKTVYIFTIKCLRHLSNLGRYERKQTPTSRGFVLPLADADHYCANKIQL